MQQSITNTLKALEQNNMSAFYVDTKEAALKMALSFVNEGSTIAVGGSVTLNQIGLLDALRNGNYKFLDRYNTSSSDEIRDIFQKSLLSDVYFSSANAITENGELYNVDGNCNRISAISFGPKSVVIIAGVNKIVKSLNDAVLRVKTVAAPLNCKRLNKNTYCKSFGECMSIKQGKASDMTAGCSSAERICRTYIVNGPQGTKGRIKVILVGEELGY